MKRYAALVSANAFSLLLRAGDSLCRFLALFLLVRALAGLVLLHAATGIVVSAIFCAQVQRRMNFSRYFV